MKLGKVASGVLPAFHEAVGRVLHAASLVVTDRRWAAPLSAMAVGFGLFIGVAIGPGTVGTFATGVPPIVEVPNSSGVSDEGEGGEGGGGSSAGHTAPAGEGSGGEAASSESLPSFTPAPFVPAGESPPPAEKTPPASTPPPTEEPEEPEAIELEGVVVHSNPAAGSYALAIKGGELVPVHASKLPAPGAKLTVQARQLANGTFAEEGSPEQDGKATRASIRGVVTFLDPNPVAPAYTLSGRGASLLIHVYPDPSGAPPQLPALGSRATVTAEIKKPAAASSAVVETAPGGSVVPLDATAAAPPPVAGSQALPSCAPSSPLANVKPAAELWQSQLDLEEGEPSTYIDLSGMVTAICPDTGQLLLSADDTRVSGQDLALTVPSKIKTAKLKVGDSFLATAEVAPDGTLALAGLSSDERVKGADDPTAAQGDLKR